MNLVVMSGNLGKDPDIRYSQAGKTVASFNLAVRRRYHKDGEDESDWFNCVAFDKKAEFCEKYLHKGSKVIVEGELHNNNYESDGVKHYRDQITITNIEFGENKKPSDQNTNQEAPTPEQKSDDGFMNIPDGIDEELPFA